jgi:hypothetical protein
MQQFFKYLLILVTALVANWWTVLPAVVLILCVLLLRWYYLRTGRELKRLEAVGTLVLRDCPGVGGSLRRGPFFLSCSSESCILSPLYNSSGTTNHKGIQKAAYS